MSPSNRHEVAKQARGQDRRRCDAPESRGGGGAGDTWRRRHRSDERRKGAATAAVPLVAAKTLDNVVAALVAQCTSALQATISGEELPLCRCSSSLPPREEQVSARRGGGGDGARRRRTRGKDRRNGAVVEVVELVTTARPEMTSGKGPRRRWSCVLKPRATIRPSKSGRRGARGPCRGLRARFERPQVVAARLVALA